MQEHKPPGKTKQSNWVPAAETVKCNRCGRANLAWQHGKAGKWYLVITRRNALGKLEAARRGFHHCQCQPAHGVEVGDVMPF